MKTVYLIRHGETANNFAKITGQDTDPLSPRGQNQATLVAHRFSEVKLDLLISSPLARALETGQAIAELKAIDLITSELFSEIGSPSQTKGKAFDDPEVAHIRQLRRENWGTKDWHYSDEENFYDASARAVQALTFLTEQSAETIAITTHGAFIRMLTSVILLGDKLTPELATSLYNGLGISNTGVTVIQYQADEKWRLIRWNDTVHLDPETNSW